MQVKRVSFALSLLVVELCLCCSVSAQLAGRIESMKLLTPDAGWASNTRSLFWTTDAGRHWTEITPPHDRSEPIKDVFFLDVSNGWVLLDTHAANRGLHAFRLAHTVDSGRNWAISGLEVPGQKPGELVGDGWLDFADAAHGWVVLRAYSSSAFSWGHMLSTDDGGAHWKELPQAPIAGRPVFATPQDGLIFGNGGGGGMFVTHDAGKTWHGTGPSLEDLPHSLPTGISYEEARFANQKLGVLLVRLQPLSEEEQARGIALAVYVTDDGGGAWRRERMLTDPSSSITAAAVLAGAIGPGLTLLATSGNAWGATMLADQSSAAITTREAESVRSSNLPWRKGDAVAGLSFTSKAHGWAITRSGWLLLTNDGGATWENVSPLKATQRAEVPILPPRKHAGAPASADGLVTAALVYDEDLAFDRNNVLPITEMNSWYTNSRRLWFARAETRALVPFLSHNRAICSAATHRRNK